MNHPTYAQAISLNACIIIITYGDRYVRRSTLKTRQTSNAIPILLRISAYQSEIVMTRAAVVIALKKLRKLIALLQ